jgi:CRP-like cAMP-binding protein
MHEGALGKVYSDGEDIVRQGEPGDCMYVIQEGTAEIWVTQEGRPACLRTVGAGELFGEMAIFEKEVRSATVRARGAVRALTIDKRTFLQRVHEDPSLAYRVCRNLSQHVRDLSDRVAHLEAELGRRGA